MSQETLFRAEAPVLFSLTVGENGRANFAAYREILEDLRGDGLIRLGPGVIKLTRMGSVAKYRNVFNYVERNQGLFRKSDCQSFEGDSRKYQRGDSYKNLHVRRTLRSLIKAGKSAQQVSIDDLRVRRTSLNRRCLVALAMDHSWSMARCRKLQYAKDSAAGLIFAVKRNYDQIALVAFSDNAIVLSPPGRHYERAIEQATRLRPDGETNMAKALLKTRILLSAAGNNFLKHSIIITDGVPTSESPAATRRELEHMVFNEVSKMRKKGITVSVICIRDELEETDTALSRKIACIGRGSFSLVNTHGMLDQVLRDYSGVKLREA